MTVPAPVSAPAQAPAATFLRPALGLLAGLGITMLVIGPAVLIATLAALRGVNPKDFVASTSYLVIVSTINFVGTFAGGYATARITAGRSFYTIGLMATIMLTSGIAHALKDVPQRGEPSWYPLFIGVLGAVGTLMGGLLQRRRDRLA